MTLFKLLPAPILALGFRLQPPPPPPVQKLWLNSITKASAVSVVIKRQKCFFLMKLRAGDAFDHSFQDWD